MDCCPKSVHWIHRTAGVNEIRVLHSCKRGHRWRHRCSSCLPCSRKPNSDCMNQGMHLGQHRKCWLWSKRSHSSIQPSNLCCSPHHRCHWGQRNPRPRNVAQHVILDWLNQPRISLILIHDLGRVVHCQVGHVKITGGADSTVKDFHATPWSIIRVVNEESPIRDTGCSRVAPRCCGVLVG